jgi:hypothetical protein
MRRFSFVFALILSLAGMGFVPASAGGFLEGSTLKRICAESDDISRMSCFMYIRGSVEAWAAATGAAKPASGIKVFSCPAAFGQNWRQIERDVREKIKGLPEESMASLQIQQTVKSLYCSN